MKIENMSNEEIQERIDLIEELTSSIPNLREELESLNTTIQELKNLL